MVLSQLQLRIGGNEVEFNGSFTLDEVLFVVQEWFKALPGADDQDRLDAITADLKAHNDGLQAVITAHTGTSATKE